jgi:hypothetical protein
LPTTKGKSNFSFSQKTLYARGEYDMSRNVAIATVFLVFAIIFSQYTIGGSSFFVLGLEPAKLGIFTGPSSVLADNNIYNSIFVQLQDANGRPARAEENTTISLSSSQTNIGKVDSTITIETGSTYGTAQFHSTYTAGSTAITATASGYLTVQTSITTVGPIPSKLAVYGLPSVLPADGNSYDAIVVQLQDTSGAPAKAPIGDVEILLSSSNVTTGSVEPTVIIKGGSTSAAAKFTAINPGKTTITAVSSGYNSGQTTITAQPEGINPTKLKVYLGPQKIPAEGTTYRQIAVQLQNSSGYATPAQQNIQVDLSSSAVDIGTVEPSITIPIGETYGVAEFYSTYRSGNTAITAVASNLESSQEQVTTVGPIPSKIAVYCAPAKLPADNHAYEAVQVQLQDSSGRPAKDPVGNVTVYLFTSSTEAGDLSTALQIPFGKTYASGTFTSTYAASSTSITAQASGYTSGQASLTTYAIDQSALQITLVANPQAINSSQQTKIVALVTLDGTTPATDAKVKFTSDNGGSFTQTKDEGNGNYTTTFTAPNFDKRTNCTITAIASKTDYTTSQEITQIQVGTETPENATVLQLCIKDANGTSINDALVLSEMQPKNVKSLSGTSNASGYVTFTDILEGAYTIKILKSGYEPVNQTINISPGETKTLTLFISKPPPVTNSSDPTMTIIIVVVVAVAAASSIVGVLLYRRRAARYRLPKKFQKRYNPPPMNPQNEL